MCFPLDVNNGGLIVGNSSSRDATIGERATYWTTPSAPVDFNTLLPEPSEWTLTRAHEVSEPGPAGELYVAGKGRHASAPATDVGIVWCVSGGVITSAGIVLAATFGVMWSMPLTGMVGLGVVVSLGVLLDTFVARSLLVPALALDLGGRWWWPGRAPRPAPVVSRPAPSEPPRRRPGLRSAGR